MLWVASSPGGRQRMRASGIRGRAFWAALCLLGLGFAADTSSSLMGKWVQSAQDINPTVRGLGPGAYVLWSVARWVIATVLLCWFWPGREERSGVSHPSFSLVFAFVLTAVGPLKLVAGAANLWLLVTGRPALPSLLSVAIGAVAGGAVAWVLLCWQAKAE